MKVKEEGKMKKEGKLTKKELSWVLYDVGNSAFTLLVATILPIYFNALAEKDGVSSAQYLAWWGYAASISTLLVAFIGPVFGAFSDQKGMKKPVFVTAVLIGVISCAALALPGSWVIFLVVFIIAKTGYAASLVFYDSMLTDVTTPERMDSVSSKGYAWGYIGSCIPFAVCLLLVLGSGSIGISMTVAMALSFVITALWWLGMTVPLLRNYQQKYYVEPQKHAVAESFRRIGRTFKNIRNEKRIFVFLLAFFFYIDGVYTFIDMATAYGSALGLGSTGLLLALLVTQLVAFPCCIIFGRLSAKYPGDILITICIAAYLGITVFAMFLTTQLQFWILAVLVGMFQGGIQALSRSYFTKIIPAEQSGEYFGFLDICGKGASFVGTAIVSIVSQLTGDISKGVGMIALLFLIGIILFRYSVKLNENVLAAADSGKKNF